MARGFGSVVLTAARRALSEKAPEAAAGVGFFAIFSFFPLLLILVVVGSTLLSWHWTQEELLVSVLKFLPVSREFVNLNMQVVLRSRGTVGVIGVAGLLWSSTSAFAALVGNLNRAWPNARQRGALRSRLVALLLVGGLTGLSLLYLGARAATSLAGNWSWVSSGLAPIGQSSHIAWRWGMVGSIFIGLTLLYRFIPAVVVRWRHAAASGAAATVAFAAVTAGFTRYLGSGLARYNVVYGSLGALVALLAWTYLLALIVLLGAHLCSSMGEADPDQDPGRSG